MSLAIPALVAPPAGGIAAPLGFGVAATAATLLGGVLGLRLASRIVLVLGLTAGIVLGVALFDLLPEAVTLGGPGGDVRATLAWVAGGLCGYMLLNRALGGAGGGGRWRAHLAPATLTLHSFMDGLGIGIAFQLSPAIGWVVALAVLTHDVADGVNTVSLCLAADRPGTARAWLLANGSAPLTGVLVGMLVQLPQPLLAPLMAMFAGVFLYIGACELIPRSHALDPRLRTTLASLLGVVLMFGVTVLAR